MAIKYKDIYNTEDFSKRVNALTSEITTLGSSSFVSDGKKQMQDTIKRLKNKQEALFDTLGVKDISDLNSRLQEYREKVVNLSGSGLAQSFISVLEAKSQKEYDGFIAAVEEIVEKDILKGKSYIEKTQNIVHNEIMKMLNEGQKKGTYRSSKGFDTFKINPKSFTTEQQRRWKEIIAQKVQNDSVSYAKAKEYIDIETIESSDKIDDTFTFTWSGISSDLTQTEAREKLPKGSIELKTINNKFKQLILSKIRDSEDQLLISLIVDHILEQEPYAFFVGKNVNEITGILGEIQGLFYISTFLRSKNSNANLIWKGGKISGNSSHKPHQDLLLDEKFGIQVKNTTKDILSEQSKVGFSENTLDYLLSSKLNLNENVIEIFRTYYGTLNFNVPYHRDEGIYLPEIRETDKNALKFMLFRNQLELLESQVEKLLSLYATSLMYLDEVNDPERNKDANILFLIGGASAYTAAEILQTIFDELEQKEKHFRINVKTNNDRNIITALNASSRDPDYSSFVVKNIYLTSSYLF